MPAALLPRVLGAHRRAIGDWLLAVGLLALFEFPADHVGVVYSSAPSNIGWALTGAVMTLALIARRRHPVGVCATTSVCAGLLFVFFVQFNPYLPVPSWPGSPFIILPAPLIALYTLTAASKAQGRFVFGASFAGFAVLMFGLTHLWSRAVAYELGQRPRLAPGPYESPALVMELGLAALITAWALGERMRARRESDAVRLAAEAAEKAEHDRAVAAEERARIARELHDITAHHISVVTLQAGTARMLAESGQPPSTELLRAIENSSRQAMTEIRQALGVIRSTPDGAAPLPGLAGLPELVTQMGLAGLTVEVDGEAGVLPGGLDLTAYRIVQEALTNVARHSQAQTAQVTLWRGSGMLQITVTDPGPARARPAVGSGSSGGNGLIGLRERVAGYGGRLFAGPRPGGGFGLRVMLPLGSAAVVPHDAAAVLPVSQQRTAALPAASAPSAAAASS
jgi:signal transduction histidine kinase